MPRSSTTWSRQQAVDAGNRGRQTQIRRAKDRPPKPAELPPGLRLPNFTDVLADHVRARCWQVDELIGLEVTKANPDAAQVDRLASAIERLAEVERRLAGRPLPGSRRPGPEQPPAPPKAVAPLLPSAPKASEHESDPTAGNYG